MQDADRTDLIQHAVCDAHAAHTPLAIQGGHSKAFLGCATRGSLLDVSAHRGVVSYEPTELVLTARSGTPLVELEQLLADNGQMLAFEPPHFADNATLGGTIACNLSGPRRASSGAARDYVLGARIINGTGQVLRFGGEVMKNVAGYDVSRLMAGAYGTLGILLDVSLKVLPRPETELTLVQQRSEREAMACLLRWAQQPLPISASCFQADTLYIRLSGSPRAVLAASKLLGGELLTDADSFWQKLKEQQHGFFLGNTPLWRLSLPATAATIKLPGKWLYEWGGALRWLRSDAPAEQVFAAAQQAGGHATLFRTSGARDQVFQPLASGVAQLHRQLKTAFDPSGILNPGRMYPGL